MCVYCVRGGVVEYGWWLGLLFSDILVSRGWVSVFVSKEGGSVGCLYMAGGEPAVLSVVSMLRACAVGDGFQALH